MRFLIALIAFLVVATVTTPADAREAGEMLPLLKRHEIQVLLAAKFSQAVVARRAGVSVAPVQRVAAEDSVTHTDDAAAPRQHRVGRPSKVTAVEGDVRTWLDAEPDLPTQELLRRALAGVLAGKSSRVNLVKVFGDRDPRGDGEALQVR